MELDHIRIAELVRQIQHGDNSAFNELYNLTSPKAYFVALQITKNEQSAEDVLQESYIKMLEKIETLSKPESFVSWFNSIVANKSKDSLKKKTPYLFENKEEEAFDFIPDEDTDFIPEENLNQEELRCAVMEAIDELTVEKRACIIMMYFEDMSVNEISKAFEISASAVKNRAFSARKDLKAKFERRGITTLYSTAPLGVIIWALSKTAESVAQEFSAGAASASVLSSINISAASATTAAATASGSAAATASTGVAAKVAAFSVTQKVVAGIVAVGVVSGSAAGITAIVKSSIEEKPTTAITEEVTTAPIEPTANVAVTVYDESTANTETFLEYILTKAEGTVTKGTETTNTTKFTSSAAQKDTTTSKKSETIQSTTVKLTTTKKATTTAVTTTTDPIITTTASTTTNNALEVITPTATEKETTTQAPTTAAPAQLTVYIKDNTESIVDTLNFTIEVGTEMTHDYLFTLVQDKGYTIMAGFAGDAYKTTAESGKTYSLNAYL